MLKRTILSFADTKRFLERIDTKTDIAKRTLCTWLGKQLRFSWQQASVNVLLKTINESMKKNETFLETEMPLKNEKIVWRTLFYFLYHKQLLWIDLLVNTEWKEGLWIPSNQIVGFGSENF